MIITIVAFNLKEVNSVAYKKCKKVSTAIRILDDLLSNDQVDFLSIRRVKEPNTE